MVSGEKRMTPSRFQDPLRPFATSHTGSGGAPEMSTFWSLPSAKNARNRLSGDQNGKVAPCVPGIGFAASSPVGRSHRRVLPSASFAANVMKRPSGDTVSEPQPDSDRWSSDFSAGSTNAPTRTAACGARRR